MPESTPEVPQKSPYVKEEDPGTYYWCACGRSENQPYCDGSHKGTDFEPVEIELDQSETVAWCGCKQTANAPRCDGTHSSL
ncbi:MAG: CDGSH iron-sulfur domain-containing protein [bacterium]